MEPFSRQSKIFSPFCRVDSSKQKYLGAGLGLSTCKKIVKSLNGSISLSSTLGQGTEVVVKIPLKVELSDYKRRSSLPDPITNSPPLTPEYSTLLSEGNTILLVSTKPVESMLSNYLSLQNFEVAKCRYKPSTSTAPVQSRRTHYKWIAKMLDILGCCNKKVRAVLLEYSAIVEAENATYNENRGAVGLFSVIQAAAECCGNVRPRIIVLCNSLEEEKARLLCRTGTVDAILRKPVKKRDLAMAVYANLEDAEIMKRNKINTNEVFGPLMQKQKAVLKRRVSYEESVRSIIKQNEDSTPALPSPAPIPEFVINETMSPVITKQQQRNGEKINVLIVDDSRTNQVILTRTLKKYGFECSTASDGSQAFDKIKESKQEYDIVFMDLMMPICDGFECTKRIRQMEREEGGKTNRIIAVTANAAPDTREQCMNVGMDDYLEKPLNNKLLLEALRRALPEDKHYVLG
eukprot:TRINITY_DN26743_c0_g1_i1.p1 TRINITY_DN26743_c0_g1~~TRINITY_DN26743_c0_g1_i1.p1  ORF type:complete len:462 (+),score=118.12 TRINITY_DN26743_c0_g1_i1:67-1452(+)